MNKTVLIIITVVLFAKVPINLFAYNSDSLLQVLDTAGEIHKAKIYNLLASDLWRDAPRKSIEYAGKALLLAKKYNLPLEEYYAYYNLSSSYGGNDTLNYSVHYAQKALEVAKKINDSLLIARAYFGLGTVYNGKDDYEKALENLLMSYKIVQDIYKNDTVANTQRLAFIANNVGIVYNRLGNADKALEYYNKSLNLKSRLNDSLAVANALNNIGLIYSNKREFEKARKYYEKSLEIKKKFKDKFVIAETEYNIFELLILENKYKEALDFYNVMESNFTILDARTQLLLLNSLASIYIKLNKLNKADSVLREAIRLALKTGARKPLANSYQLLSEYYAKTGSYKKAFEYQSKYIHLNDSLLNSEMISKISEVNAKYETEKKEKQIALLQRDKLKTDAALNKQKIVKLYYAIASIIILVSSVLIILIIWYRQKRKSEKLLTKSIETEQRLLRSQMNPHFIYNTLNSVQGFISAKNDFMAMKFLSKFGTLMRNILENSRHNLVPLNEEIDTLKLYIDMEHLRKKDAFDYKIDISDDIDTEFVLVPPLIIQPFVENAIKHGFRNLNRKGELLIRIKKENEQLIVEISDNGMGRDKALLEKSINGEKRKSLGMELTSERISLLKKVHAKEASFSVFDLKDDDGNATGTRVVINLPFISV